MLSSNVDDAAAHIRFSLQLKDVCIGALQPRDVHLCLCGQRSSLVDWKRHQFCFITRPANVAVA